MSMATMTDRALAAKDPPLISGVHAPDVAKAIAAVAAYFPTETIGTYLAVLAILQPTSDGSRWAFYAVFLAFTALVVLYYGWKKAHATTGAQIDRRSLVWLLIFSAVSFTLWSATTPWTPFKELTNDAQKYAGAAIIGLSPLLPMAAQVLRISPPWSDAAP